MLGLGLELGLVLCGLVNTTGKTSRGYCSAGRSSSAVTSAVKASAGARRLRAGVQLQRITGSQVYGVERMFSDTIIQEAD